MIQLFDSIDVEVYNGTWVNVTNDVLQNPGPAWNRGIMGNKPDDHVGNSGFLTFTLDNSVNNMAGLAGYYSPGHVNCWAGWTSGLIVRLSFTFEGVPYYKYYGRIRPDGLDVKPGIYGVRTVEVTCGDFMWRAAQHELKTLAFATNQRIGDVVTAVNANMPIPPLATSIATGVEIFSTIFDMTYLRTTALAEYIKSAMSEWAYIYVKGDKTGGETLVVENQNTRTGATITNIGKVTSDSGFLLTEDGDCILSEYAVEGKLVIDEVLAALFDNIAISGMKTSFGKTQVNRVNSYVYPRRVDAEATTILWSLEKSFKIEGNTTVTDYRVGYRDPDNPATRVSNIAGTNSSTTKTATANEDGTGEDMSASLVVTADYGTESVIYQLQNTNSTALWVQTLVCSGKGVYTYDSIQSTRNDATSQAIHGIVPLSLDFKYLTKPDKAQAISDYILSREALPRLVPETYPMWANIDGMRMMGFLQLEPGSYATFIETQTGISKNCFINGYTATIVNGKYVLWEPILKDDAGYYTNLFVWDTSAWDGTDVWA